MPVTLRADIAALAPYRQGRPASASAYKLSSNENPFPPLPAVLAAIGEATLNRYPDGAATALRARLAERAGIPVEQVHVGSGSVSILQQLIQAAAGPGDEVLYSWRSFEAYPGLVTVAGASSVRVPNTASEEHDLPAMIAAITDRTRVILVCTPNNPTSTIVTAAAFAAFMSEVPDTVLVVLDEAYREFVTDPEAVDGLPLLQSYPNLVVLRTFSKAYGLAGLRVGYAFGPAYVLDAARAAAIPLSVTEPAQRAALAALEPAAESELLGQVRRLNELRDELAIALADQGWVGDLAIPAAQGNFVWLPTGEQSALAAEILERGDIIARVFPHEGIRVSVGEPESVPMLLRATAEVVETLQNRSETPG